MFLKTLKWLLKQHSNIRERLKKALALEENFGNYKEYPTFLSKEFKKSHNCFSQVNFYFKKSTQSALKQAVL